MSSLIPTLSALADNPSTLNPPFGQAPNRLHETPMAAALIGVARSSLEVDRCRRRWRIDHVKIGRKILYREADLLAFIDRCAVKG